MIIFKNSWCSQILEFTY